MLVHEQTAISTALHPPKVWERFFVDVYSILKGTHMDINNLHQSIKFTMDKESNRELAFLETLLKWNKG